jgi:hypothetical protein
VTLLITHCWNCGQHFDVVGYGGEFDGVHECESCYAFTLKCEAEAAAEMAAEVAQEVA